MKGQRKVSTGHIIKHSQSLQDLINKGFKTDRKSFYTSQIKTGERTRAPAYVHRLAVDSIVTHQGSLILLNGPNAVEVCKPCKGNQSIHRASLGDVYLPAITGKMSKLQTPSVNLSRSGSYMHPDGRRGSTLSVVSQRAKPVKNQHMNCLKEQKDLRKSNVLVTMTYLNQGKQETTRKEMKVLQQSCGGENICVFKGHVQPGDQFQFSSQRHLGYPFSITFYVNGIVAGRISSCCEYRYTPGFQQGRRSCFRLTRLSGGKPCYKCVNSRHINNEANKCIHLSQQIIQSPTGSIGSRRSSPLFIPVGMENSQRTRNLFKDSNTLSTDSEDKSDRTKPIKIRQKRQKSRRQQIHCKSSEESKTKTDTGENESKPPAMNHFKSTSENRQHAKIKSKTDNKDRLTESSQDGEALSQQTGKKVAEQHESNGESRNQERPRDFFEECVKMSTGLELGQDQQKWFKASAYERNKIREQLIRGPHSNKSVSELELSEESDTGVVHLKNEKPRTGSISQVADKKTKEELQEMFGAMVEMLNAADEVEQLVLRNTGVTDELLQGLVMALKSSQSEVTMINLNLNQIGPAAVQDLLDLLQAKPEIKGLLLFGNHLGDVGAQILLCGVADLQDKRAAPPSIPAHPRQFYLPELLSFTLVELDLGGNGIGSEGLKVLGTFMRFHSHLQYLGLAQTSCSDMEAWNVLFTSLKVNNKLNQIILDENNLGDQGVKLFAEALRVNGGLQKIDLDCNSFGDVGGNALLEALLFRSLGSLQHLSLDENYISTALLSKIQQLLNPNPSTN